MLVRINDVLSRIDEPPKWYTKEGYPRYDDFKPKQCSIYAEFSALFLIACEDCDEQFEIGVEWNASDLYQYLIDASKIPKTKYNRNQTEDFYLHMPAAIYAPKVLDPHGNPVVKTATLEELVETWDFGDPPSHGCIGDTMGSIPLACLEAWNLKFGRTTKRSPNGIHEIIDNFGSPKRITELEKAFENL